MRISQPFSAPTVPLPSWSDSQAGLSDDDSKEVVALVARRAQEQRLLPIMSMPFTLPDGSSTVMDVFKGDDLEEVVESFVEEHELPDAAREKLVQLAGEEGEWGRQGTSRCSLTRPSLS